MKLRKPSLALVIAITLLCTSCGKTTNAEQTDSVTDQISTINTEGLISGVPEGTDLRGETINIWYTDVASSITETLVDLAGELTGETLDDAIYNANRAVEEKLSCTLNFFNSGVESRYTGDSFKKLMLADDTSYDIYNLTQWNSALFAAEGYYMNMADAPYISYDQPWWDYTYMKEMTIGEDTIHALVGDYTVDRVRCLDCVFFNKNMYEDFYGDPNGLYQEVINGEWTLDRLRQISADVFSDLNNNGTTDPDDRLGYSIGSTNVLDSLFYGMGGRTTRRSADDTPELILNGERNADICDLIYRMVFEFEGSYYAESDPQTVRTGFENGNSMFYFGFLYTSEALRDMNSDFGIIPNPLFDENQSDYISIVHDIMRFMGVPANCQKREAVSAVMEELSFRSYSDVLPEYYDILLKHKYARDDISAQMIDLIRDGCAPDIAHIYAQAFNMVGYLPRYMVQNRSSFASEYASREPSAKALLSDFIEQYRALEK